MTIQPYVNILGRILPAQGFQKISQMLRPAMPEYDDSGFFEPGSSTSFGIQGYLGLDYTFEDLPLNLTVDWIPTIFLNGFNNGFGGSYGSLGIRYVLDR